MKHVVSTLLTFALTASLPPGARADDDAAAKLDMHRIEEVTGAKGELDEKEGVFKVSVPRSDLSVTAMGVRFTPPMGLTSWAAFKPVADRTMVMGDMVVLEEQVSAVMDAALESGLEVTALHNHFAWETPKVMFMHIGGIGWEETLARGVGRVFKAIRETSGGKGMKPSAKIDPRKTTLDPEKIEAILGTSGVLDKGVYKVVVGRETTMHGHAVGSAMGVNTWAAFAGSDDEAVVDGDFAMFEDEVQTVLTRLRAANIHVVALHNHMVGEEPAVYFLHYWGIGATEKLANGLKAALDATAGGRSSTRAGASPKITIDFERSAAGELPAGFHSHLTGDGPKGSWKVVADETASSGRQALAQVSDDGTKGRFPLCVYDGVTAKDVAVRVRLRPISGDVDQAGGIVWRYRDADNYYVVRANALEDNVVLYKVEDGKRTDLKPIGAGMFAYGKKLEIPSGEWSELRVVAIGNKHSVHFEGQHLFDVEDETFSGSGRVGLWTKADSVTRFDDIVIETLDGGSGERHVHGE